MNINIFKFKTMSTNQNLAKLAINKSLLKEYSNSEYSRIVYMNDNSEFQIQIFNPYTYTIGINITIDNKSLGNTLVVKPGERIWLERYLNDANKFLFSTYEVNGNSREVKEAIAKNGEIKLEFYKEKQNNYFESKNIYLKKYDYNICGCDCNGPFNGCGCDCTPINADLNLYNATTTTANTPIYEYKTINSSLDNTELNLLRFSGAISKNCSDNDLSIKNRSKKIETGRIEKGSHSDQKFNIINIDFEYWPFTTEIIKILPVSQKPVFKNDLIKRYCSNCGRKLNSKYKFCPYCGFKL